MPCKPKKIKNPSLHQFIQKLQSCIPFLCQYKPQIYDRNFIVTKYTRFRVGNVGKLKEGTGTHLRFEKMNENSIEEAYKRLFEEHSMVRHVKTWNKDETWFNNLGLIKVNKKDGIKTKWEPYNTNRNRWLIMYNKE